MNRPEVQNKGTGKGKEHNGTSHRGIARTIRAHKREEATDRNKRSAPASRRAFWRERGFTRKSHAQQAVNSTVQETNSSVANLRNEIGLLPLRSELLNQAS